MSNPLRRRFAVAGVASAVTLLVAAGIVVAAGQPGSNSPKNERGRSHMGNINPAARPEFAHMRSTVDRPPRDASGEGITVHGAWTIDVLNPDGSVANAFRFENALLPTTGSAALARIMTGTETAGSWLVFLQSDSGAPSPCGTNGSTIDHCVITEPGSPVTTPFKNLDVTASGGTIVLSGSAIAGQDSTITTVQTSLWGCAASTPPSACVTGSSQWGFTQKTGLSIAVTKDQGIAVRVEISFS